MQADDNSETAEELIDCTLIQQAKIPTIVGIVEATVADTKDRIEQTRVRIATTDQLIRELYGALRSDNMSEICAL